MMLLILNRKPLLSGFGSETIGTAIRMNASPATIGTMASLHTGRVAGWNTDVGFVLHDNLQGTMILRLVFRCCWTHSNNNPTGVITDRMVDGIHLSCGNLNNLQTTASCDSFQFQIEVIQGFTVFHDGFLGVGDDTTTRVQSCYGEFCLERST